MYTTYDPKTGRIVNVISDRRLADGLPCIPGTYLASDYYVRNNRPYKYPARPGPGSWRWDVTDEVWLFDAEQTAHQIRQLRDQALARVDRVNPMWYESIGQQRQEQLQAYRQALLDITDQPGFPRQVQWPVRPEWL